ncbi:MAG: sensor histidine kinase [Lachnospiraceae bacterium]|nr:sensor histidine kinase [Lachnospiraceae bacterium]
MKTEKIKYPLKNKLIVLVLVAMVPILYVAIYLILALVNYSRAYDQIVNSMLVANAYNINFKEEMDESLYKLVVSNITFGTIEEDGTLKNPYKLIDELRTESNNLLGMTTDRESRVWLQSLLRNLDTLKDRVDDIKANQEAEAQYEQNIDMLYSDIYILTELIQDDIQYYIYYQTKSIEQLKIQLNKEVERVIIISILLGGCIVAAVILITSAILNSITKPIQELCGITSRIAEGNFSDRVRVRTEDELEALSDSVNDMSENLEVMVNQIKEDERKMRHAELRLLQEQINPHFLYNTLDTIVWLIEGDDPDKAVDVVVALSEFFRLVLSKGKETISIREEAEHIRGYLDIQQARYQDILDYEIAILPELYAYKILKLTLQPLVENSLYHGIKYKRAKGKIWVTGVLQRGSSPEKDTILLCVQDNGIGMDADEVERLQSEIAKPCKETERGFGLANVNERIRMNYGMEYGMTIESEKGVGTKVSIVIPAVRLSEPPAGEWTRESGQAGSAENTKGESV